MINFLAVGFEAGEGLLRTVWVHFCKIIYPLIGWAFNLFVEISRFELINSVEFNTIYKRITLLLAIIMVFYVTFQFVKYVVQPDTMTDKEKGVGNIAYKMIAVVVLIAFVPTIFSFAYKVQSTIIDSQIFTKIFLGKQSVDTNYFGRQFAKDTFSLFYYYDASGWEDTEGENKCDGISCKALVEKNYDTLMTMGRLPYLSLGINESGTKEETFTMESETESESVSEPYINFDGFLAVVFGGFMVYMLIMYCIDVGARAVQLVFLQIIAPIPIIGYLSPKKDGIFQKWCKQCLTTYLDLFIRFAIIYFILLVCQTLLNSSLYTSVTSPEVSMWVKIALIMGLLMFAKRAPKMLQELFPSSGAASGTFGLGYKDRISPAVDAVKGTGKVIGFGRRVTGAAGGTIAGLIAGRGSLSAAAAGAKAGFAKDKKGLWGGSAINRIYSATNAGAGVYQQNEDIKTAGGNPFVSRFFGGVSKNIAQAQDRKLNKYKSAATSKDNIIKAVDEFKQIKALKAEIDSLKNSGAGAAAIKTAEAKYKAASQKVRETIMANGGQLPTGPVNFTYDQIDDNGHKIPGTTMTETYRFDSGDDVFASGLRSIAMAEFRNRDDLGDLMIEIGNQKRAVSSLNEEEFTTYIHKIADAAYAKEKEISSSKEYTAAHTNAKGVEKK